jgi:hypothetical protein
MLTTTTIIPPPIKQDRQCTYDETLRRVYETTVDVERQKVLNFSVCVCVGGGGGVCVGAWPLE